MKEKEKKTNNTGYSLVVTDPTTNPALTGLTRGERTGSRIFQWVWSFVGDDGGISSYKVKKRNLCSLAASPRFCSPHSEPTKSLPRASGGPFCLVELKERAHRPYHPSGRAAVGPRVNLTE